MTSAPDKSTLAAELAAALGLALAPLVARLDALHANADRLQARIDALHARGDEHAAATLDRIARLEHQGDGLAAGLADLKAQAAAAAEAAAAAAAAAAMPAAPSPAPFMRAVVSPAPTPAFGLAPAAAHDIALVSPSIALSDASLLSPTAPMRRRRLNPSNMWDRMPTEIQHEVLGHASVLTQFINGRINGLTWKQFLAVWVEVFETDWQGDLAKLPVDLFKITPWFTPFWHLRSRSMYARVRALGHSFFVEGLEQAAICNGWTDLLDFGRPRELSMSAAECGSIAMLRHLVDERKAVTLEAQHAVHAACYGHLELLKWLAARMPSGSWTSAVMDWAACNGHLDCVKWLHANRTEGCSANAMNWAAKNGHLDTVTWLHNNRTEGCTTDAMDLAAEYGNPHIVEFLHKSRTEGCTTKAMLKAAENGNAAVVEFLHKNRTEGVVADAAMAAARKGRLEVIKRIHAFAPESVKAVIADEAAANGRSGLLDWLVDNTSARPTEDAISRAAKSGHLRLLPWFRDRQPALFRSHAMSRIGVRSGDAAMDWFKRSKLPSSTADVLRLAIKEGRMDAVRWLLWHLPDTKWHEGDAECARWMMRVM